MNQHRTHEAELASRMPPRGPKTVGFTLIELSIVLVIIGLIVGGILVGQDLIRAAEIRSVLTDIEKFNTAANTFEGKYGCLPGDCANATTFWPQDAKCSAFGNPLSTPATSTCNGNGDGIIEQAGDNSQGNSQQPPFYHPENFLFWQPLALAGLIPGIYNGISSFDWDGATAGTNVPVSHISGGCYSMEYTGYSAEKNYGATSMFLPNPVWNVYFFGSALTVSGNPFYPCLGPLITPNEALRIDQKIDDGVPNTGTVQTFMTPTGVGWNLCVFTGGAGHVAPWSYDQTNSSPVCQLIFKAQF